MSDQQRILLEVAVASVDDAVVAQAGGADRLELNAALALGGLTPSLGSLLEVKAAVNLPVIAMLRPRPSGFAYSDAEFRVMQRDLDLLLEHGADGVAFGVLHEDGTIDAKRCRALHKQMGPQEPVFHRAFDVTPNPVDSLEQLIALGFRRVMTSGQEESAYNGAECIADLIERAQRRIEILPAGGINRFTLDDVVTRTGCDQVHASLRTRHTDGSVHARPHINFGGAIKLAEDRYDRTHNEGVANLRSQLDEL